MRTNIDIDEGLLAEAGQRCGLTDNRKVVEFVLKRYIKLDRQREALEGLRGIGWEGDLDDMRTSKYIPSE